MIDARQIINEIDQAELEFGEVAYIDGKGEWTRSTNGNQPSNTFSLNYSDFLTIERWQLAELLGEWLEG